jgi:hypothetical protein
MAVNWLFIEDHMSCLIVAPPESPVMSSSTTHGFPKMEDVSSLRGPRQLDLAQPR